VVSISASIADVSCINSNIVVHIQHIYLTAPTTKEGKCKRDPPCELWEEDFLLDEQERRRYPLAPVAPAQLMVPGRFAPQPPVPAIVQRHIPLHEFDGDLDWMDNPRMSSCIAIPELPFESDCRHPVWASLVHHQYDSQPQLRVL
jgi:hypothetical protein